MLRVAQEDDYFVCVCRFFVDRKPFYFHFM